MSGSGASSLEPRYDRYVRKPTDPRVAHVDVVDGPSDLAGRRLVVGEVVTLNGETVWVPKVHPGVPELVAVAEAEQKAEQLRHELVSTLATSPVAQGPTKRQTNETLVVDLRSAAETTVISAVVGLEAFCSHHLAHYVDRETGTLTISGEHLTPHDIRNRFSLDERYKLILPELLARPTPTGEEWWPVLRRVQDWRR